jgi:hypothetical protein
MPHPAHLHQLLRHQQIALWQDWQALALHDNVVFLGAGPHGLPRWTLAENVEQDYFNLYLVALFQKLWLSVMFSEMVRPRNRLGQTLPAVRRLFEAFLLFQNRYWFLELTRRPLPTEIYRRFQQGLGVPALYEELAAQIRELHQHYLCQSLRRVFRLSSSVVVVAWPLALLISLFTSKLLDREQWFLALAVSVPIYLAIFGVFLARNWASRD